MKEKVLILGLSKSGIAAAKFANKQGYDVFITESKPLDKVKEECKSQVEELKNLGIKIAYKVKNFSERRKNVSSTKCFGTSI